MIALTAILLLGCNQNKNMNTLTLTQEWDKTFPKSDLVNHSKVTFHNRYGIELAADMYIPKNAEGKLPAIAVSGPFGAVKEQPSGRKTTKPGPTNVPVVSWTRSRTMLPGLSRIITHITKPHVATTPEAATPTTAGTSPARCPS